jgi:DNA-binding transcriptional ArsR family regulator
MMPAVENDVAMGGAQVVGELEHPEREAIELVEVLQALGDPVRLQIVRFLADCDGMVACHEIPIPVSKSTGSHHLKVLREAGVVRGKVDGTRKYHTLRRDDLEARFPGLLDSVLRAEDGAEAPALA